ncbi:MAG: PPC domain-containing protein [Gemmatimonadota bacterium]
MRGSSPVVGPRRRLFRSLLPLLCFAGLGPRAIAQEPDGPSILALLPVDGAPLRIGEERSGTLGEQDYRTTNDVTVRAFELAGAEGRPISVDLISEAFDAYLFLLGPDGSELASDDDSGGACHARRSQCLPVDGSYRVVGEALSGSGGAFTLRVGDRQARPSPATARAPGTSRAPRSCAASSPSANSSPAPRSPAR